MKIYNNDNDSIYDLIFKAKEKFGSINDVIFLSCEDTKRTPYITLHYGTHDAFVYFGYCDDKNKQISEKDCFNLSDEIQHKEIMGLIEERLN